IKVDEPTPEKAIDMMRRLAAPLEKHHQVQILDSAIEAAVKLSHRHIQGRQLPDKAVSLLDTACARVPLTQFATPAEVEDCTRRSQNDAAELRIIGGGDAGGHDRAKRRGEIEARLAEQRERLAVLEQRWKDELELVNQILAIRAKLRAAGQSLPEPGSAATPP